MIATLLAAATWAQATLTQSQSFSGGTIPDGSQVGTIFTGTFSQTGFNSPVLGANVSLDITGGYNGDLYAYLVAPNGTMVLLLNQPGVAVNGFGASGAGMNLMLTDATGGNGAIQSVTSGGILSGNYNAAGTLANFNNSGPGGVSVANGTWTLFFADLGAGGGTGPSVLNGWSLELTVVPEPVTLALGAFALMLVSVAGLKWVRRMPGHGRAS